MVRFPCCYPRSFNWCAFGALLALTGAGGLQAENEKLAVFERDVQPILDQYCYDCHGYGSDKGGVTLDGFADDAALLDHDLWLRALKNVRSEIMPPSDEAQPTPEELEKLVQWIKQEAFNLDPQQPDPGRVTARRLNRVEYRNTIRDLLGVDHDTSVQFPADDTGHGFDNIGDVLTISPMLMEKYLDAAQTVVEKAVPTRSRVVPEHAIAGREFAVAVPPPPVDPAVLVATAGTPPASDKDFPLPVVTGNALDLYYYSPLTIATTHRAPHDGKYQVVVELKLIERYVDNVFDYNQCRIVAKIDGEPVLEQTFVREGNDKAYRFELESDWTAGDHQLTFEVHPLTPDQPRPRLLRVRLNQVTVRGPLAPEYWVKPTRYDEFFPREVPAELSERREYARELLAGFVTRAFRRPVEESTVERLVELAESVYTEAGNTFEDGVAQGMVAALAAPGFIFRQEADEPLLPGERYPQVDEFTLASRLSYFLWSTMPDAELFRLAEQRQLRAQLPAQLDRMLNDPRSAEFVRNFAGQWLQARDVDTVSINSMDIFLRDHPDPEMDKARAVFRRLETIRDEDRTPEDLAARAEAIQVFRAFRRATRPDLTSDLRDAMRDETELYFGHIIREDRSLLELLDSNYTFLNQTLAQHYGIDGVLGEQMRKVELPPESPRGGVLTQGTVLTVTSNPTRTSPVKRGVFILEAILGTPPAPPPPNIPSLEDAASPEQLAKMSLRETMALHATNKLCASCHERMDPLGLALENFNALGQWRVSEMNQPIDPAGELITGEAFEDVRDLKRILATERRHDFYHSISEKLLTYALGRGVEYYDTDTLDHLAHRLEESGGRPSVLIRGIIDSPAFQKRRPLRSLHAADSTESAQAQTRLTHVHP